MRSNVVMFVINVVSSVLGAFISLIDSLGIKSFKEVFNDDSGRIVSKEGEHYLSNRDNLAEIYKELTDVKVEMHERQEVS